MASNANTPGTGTGNQAVGKVFILYGTAKAQAPDGTVRVLAPNSPIFAHDQIITESDGSVSIQFDGPPVTQLDLGRMSNVTIDEDVYAGAAPGITAEAAAEAEQIQQALLAGDQPIDLEATAAGVDGGAGGGLTSPFSLVLTGESVTPTSGAGTIGPLGSAALPGTSPEANNAPVAFDASASGTEDNAAISGTVPAATDADGDAVTYALFGGAPAGVSFNADGTFSVAPLASDQALKAGDSREVTFQYVANDGTVNSAPATVTVTINGLNDAPVLGGGGAAAGAASASGTEDDASISGAVPAATDVDGDALTYVLVGTPPVGVTFNPNGTFSVVPQLADQGLDTGESRVVTFQYVANDGTVNSAPATVTVTINGVNDAPVASPASASGTEDAASITGSVSATDVDVEALTYSVVGTPPVGVTFNPNGTFSVVPQLADQGLDTGESRVVTFQYVANDGTVDSAPATVTVTINGVNDAPVASPASASGTEDAASITGSVSATDVDVEALTYSVVGTPPVGVTFNPNGTFSVAPLASDQGLDTGESRVVTFQYVANDGTVNSAPATVTVTINGVNDAPVASPASASGTEDDASITGTVPAATDVDIEALTYSVVGTAPAGVTFNPNGTFSVAPLASDQGLDTGVSRVVTFQYVANDGTVDSAPATVTVTINGVNDAPVASDDTLSATEDTPVIYTAAQLLGNDTDAEGDMLTIAGVTSGNGGTAVLNLDGTVTFTPNANFNGTADFTYTATDGSLTSNTATVTVNVASVNDLPVAVNDNYSVAEDSVLTITASGVLGNDSIGGDGGLLAVTSYTQPGHGSLALNTNGGFTYTPEANYNGSDSFTYTITDANGDPSTATVAIGVTSVNDLPTAVNDSYTTAEDTALTITASGVLGNDSIGGDGGLLAVTSYTQPGHGSLALNTNGGFTYTPEANYNGSDSFTYTITDANGDPSTATVAIGVTSVNDLPTAVNDSYTTAEDTALTITASGVLGNDSIGGDGGLLAVTSYTQPGHGSLALNTNGGFTYTPVANYNGSDSFTYTITDANGDPSTATVAIGVTSVNDLPTAVNDSYTTAEDTSLTITASGVLGNDSIGGDGGLLAVTSYTQPGHGSLALNTNGGFTYTPVANYNGSDSFTYTITDANGDPSTATVAIGVTSVNDLPTAVNDSYTTAEDTSLTITASGVLGNDSIGGDGGLLAVTSYTQPGHGSLALNTNGGFTYTPVANYNGSDSFTYTITDANGDPSTATVAIGVTSVNDLPTAVNDSYTTAEDTSLTITASGVLGNDSIGGDGGLLAVTSYTQPGHGSLALNTNGGFTYTPEANYNGSDSFTYTITDANGDPSTATVAIGVTSVNDNPDAVDDSETVSEDSTANVINVLANDSILPDTGETLTVTGVGLAAHGTAALVGGAVQYTPNANYFGSDSFTYTISDGNGGTDTATVNVTVTNVNDNPDAVDDSKTVSEDSSANVINVLGNDSFAPDAGETLTVTAVGAAAHGTATLVGGAVQYTPTPNYFGNDSFTYTISDGNGGTDTATVNVTVTNVNDNPDAVDDSKTVSEDSSANVINVLGNDSFAPDAGETLTVTAVGAAAHGTATLVGGAVQYTPTPNYFGNDSFTYTISDGNGGTDTATVNVTVTNVNDNPDAVDDSKTVSEDSSANVINVLGNDSFAPDAGETLTVTAVGAAAHGTATLVGGAVQYTPTPNYFGNDSFTYTISDGNGGTDTATVNVTVTNVNDNPDAVDDSKTVSEDSSANVINVLGNDSFAPDAGETLTVTAVGAAAHGTATLVGGAVQYTPTPNYFGNDSFTYTISDGNGGTDTATVNVTVTNVNDNPDAVDDSKTVSEDSSANVINVLGNDSFAPDAGETLTVTAVGAAAHGTATLVGGAVQYTPTPNYFGNDSFTYTISDGNGGTDTATVNVTVTNVNDNPDAVDDSKTVSEDSSANVINVLGNDSFAPDAGETLTVTAVGAAAHGTATLVGGAVQYTPTPNYFGNDSFTYTISDGNGGTDTATVNVTVTNVNDNPDAVDDSKTVSEDSSANVINVLGNDSFAPDAGETLTVTAVGAAAHGTATLVGGAVQYTPTPNYFGNDSFTYTISDGNGGTDTATVNVTVTNVNDNPDAVDDSKTVSEDSSANVINVLGNDSFAPDAGETLTVTAVGAAAHGTATLVGGAVQYTPTPNYFGNDSFTYTISDGNGGTDTATVNVTVTNVNDNPDAVDDSKTVSEDSSANVINVLGNDSFAPDAGETLTVTAVGAAAHGTATLVGGAVQYTPTPNYFGNDSFTYTISDGNGGTDTATVNVTVTNVNDNPDAVDDSKTVSEDSSANVINVLGNDSFAPDAGETLTVTAVGAAAHGTATLVGGAVQYTPTPNYFGNDSFTYTISDGNGGTDTATVNVTVTNVNDNPDAVDDSKTVSEDSSANVINVLGNDSFAPDAGETLTVTAVGAAAHGTATLVGGAVQYTPTPNYFGNDSFTYTISDGNGGTDTATVNVTVTNVNDAPTVETATVHVSEEGLAFGIEDSTPVTSPATDTTNFKEDSGTIIVSDPDNSSFTFTLATPTAALTSHGTSITWTGGGTDELLGKAGSSEIFNITIDNTGHYHVTMSGTIDHPTNSVEDVKSFDVTVNVSDGIVTTPSTGTITVNVEDDMPAAVAITHTGAATTAADTNLMVILDCSTSMDNNPGVAGFATRLAVAKEAITQLIDDYDGMGEVMVRLVLFNDTASAYGSQWITASAAKTYIDSLADNYGNGSTNYDAALLTAQTAFASAGKIAGGQNVSYFLSDGDPTANSDWPSIDGTLTQDGIQSTEQAVWESFLKTNDIASFALGMGAGATLSNLQPIAYNGMGAGSEMNAIVVTDFGQLSDTLVSTISTLPISGHLAPEIDPIAGATNGFGADGGHVQSITVNGTTYTYNPASGGSIAPTGGSDHGSFNTTENELTVTVNEGGSLVVNMDNGSYTYTPPSTLTADINATVGYVLIDNDGDTAGSTLTFTIDAPDAPNVAPNTNAGSGAGSEDATSIAVSLSGTDTDGTVAAFKITSLPANGTLFSDAALQNALALNGIMTATGNAATVYFDPAANFNGSTTFQYAAIDNDSLQDPSPATATISISPDAGPVATDDTILTAINNDATFTVPQWALLANDTAGHDGPAAIASVTESDSNLDSVSLSGANVSVDTDKNFDPPSDTAHFTYVANDGSPNSNDSADVTVKAVDDSNITGTGSGEIIVDSGSGHTLDAGGGNDILFGNAGDDILIGGAGKDIMTGGTGADTFKFNATSDSSNVLTLSDVIKDFSHSEGDKIDLSAIDAKTQSGNSGDQSFAFKATEDPNTVANSITWSLDHANSQTIIHIDTNGDTTADMQIILDGLLTPVDGDFIK